MTAGEKLGSFETVILPHLGAAYNLARWLTRNTHDAEDLVQESYLKAFKSFDGFRGGNGRAWLLMIVRNTCYTWLKQNRKEEVTEAFNEEIHSAEEASSNPETLMLDQAGAALIKEALEELPVEFREAIVLREIEGMSYKEIGQLTNVPVGTVMSRLARARERLQRRLAAGVRKES